MRGFLDYIFLYIKALCIGATGVLHGISGGSMALLMGVYERFIRALSAIDGEAFHLLRQKGFFIFWRKIDGTFLLVMGLGIISGFFVLRAVLGFYYAQFPIFISSFFFSLVIIAALLLLRKIRRWNPGVVMAILAGLLVSYALTRIPPVSTPDNLAMVFVAGIFCGITFIIPGVSGAFILIFFGKYQHILASFDSLALEVLILFVAGGILGITVFSRLVASLLNHYYNATVGLFAGLMIGSLNKVWPWREVLEYATTLHGRRVPAFDQSILPWRYLETTGKDPQVFYALLMMAMGVLMVVIIEKIAARLKTRS